MRQDTHAQGNADWNSICTAASQACTSAGIPGELYQWGEHEPGISTQSLCDVGKADAGRP